MEEDGGESGTPFWVQSNAGGRRGDGVRRRVESAVFSSGILVFLLVVGAVFFMVFVLPWTASFTSGLFRASSVKKSWDSVNVVLVFLAIVFGVLSRSKNELQKSNPGTPVWYGYRDEERRRSNPAGFDRWVESADRRSFNGGGGGLRRSFSSYPDLCEMSPRWVSADDQWRFYDDTRVDASRVYDSGQIFRRRSWREVDRVPEAESNKIVYIDTVNEAPLTAPSSPPPPQAAAEAAVPEPVYKDKKAAAPESVYKVESKRKTRAHKKPVTPSPPPPAASPPPPPPSPPPLPHYVEPKSSKSERKRSSSSGTKGFIISSLYHKRKRKQRSQSTAAAAATALCFPKFIFFQENQTKEKRHPRRHSTSIRSTSTTAAAAGGRQSTAHIKAHRRSSDSQPA
nr:formin-like protein 20 [Ipomoea batatas]